MEKKSEKQFYQIIERYLREKGYKTKVSYKFLDISNNEVDVLGFKPLNNTIVSVEVKTTNFKKALYQANDRQTFSDYVYVAFPEKYAYYVRDKYGELLRDMSIGLLSVNGYVQELIEPSLSPIIIPKFKQLVLYKLKKVEDRAENSERSLY